MGDNKSSGISGILGLAIVIALFLAAKRFFPGLSTILLILAGVFVLLIIVIVVLVIVFSKKGSKSKDTSNAIDTSAIAKGRTSLMEVRNTAVRINNQDVKRISNDICNIADKILRTLKEQPEDINNLRQFFSYYLPTTGNILKKYSRLEQSGIPADNMTESTINCLTDIKKSMDKQYQSIFEDDILDLTVEMEVLTLNCKRDGLLNDADFKLGQ